MRTLLLCLLLPACGGSCAVGTATPSLQLSYEAMPGEGIDVGVALPEELSYESRADFSENILEDLVPPTLEAAGLDASAAISAIRPGGYEGATNPSMQSLVDTDDEGATRAAAALGFVLHQWAVLAADYSDGHGGTAWGAVRFLDGAPDADQAQAFYTFAAAIDPGLSGGYSAWSDRLLFLNLRDASGAPLGGLDDDAFLAALTRAASDYTDDGVALAASGEARAWLVENDWTTAPNGEDYLSTLGADEALTATLQDLQHAHTEALAQRTSDGGW